MDEEEFYRRNKGMPGRQPTWNPFGYAPVLASSNSKWAKWFARIILLSIPISMIVGVLSPNSGIDPYQYNESGNSKMENGDVNGAMEDYTKALEVFPNDPVINYNRGVAKYNLGDTNGACIDFRKASKLGRNESLEAIQEVCQ